MMTVGPGHKDIYISTSRTTLAQRFTELISYRTLLWTLAWRDIKVRYKQSLLGIMWALFVPVSMTLLFSFVFTRVVAVKTDIPYPLFAYCGLLPWQLFSSATTNATNCLVANRTLVTKIYFPAEVFPISTVIVALVDFLIGALALVGLMWYFYSTGAHIIVSWTAVLVIEILFVQTLFMTGLSFFLSMSNLFFRDVKYIFSVLITLWMFASSVVYPMHVANLKVQRILNLNPLTPMFDAYRDVLLRGKVPDPSTFGYAAAVSVVVFSLGWVVFYKMQYKFAEKV